jgi:transposase
LGISPNVKTSVINYLSPIPHIAMVSGERVAPFRCSSEAELKSFAQGIRRDYVAVRAVFSSQWSNGQVETQVNCLKLQKRLMFDRANFDLLRLRVL